MNLDHGQLGVNLLQKVLHQIGTGLRCRVNQGVPA
jgi:hypothetical protein